MIKTITVDDQNYDMIVEHARKAIRKYAPYWTDENAHDPGITMIELFSWLKEMLQFYMDQTTEPIEYQFLKLLGVTRDYGQPATMVVQCLNSDQEFYLPYKSKLTKGRYTFETESDVVFEAANINDVIVHALGESRSVYQNIINGLTVYPFGTDCIIGNSFTLCYDAVIPADRPHQLYINVFEDYEVKRNRIESHNDFVMLSQLQWLGSGDGRNWTPLELLKDDTYGFIQSGFVSLKLPEIGEHPEGITQIKVVIKENSYDVPPRIIDVFNRVIAVTQTDSACYYSKTTNMVVGENFYFDSTGLPNHEIKLPFEDLYYKNICLEVLENQNGQAAEWKQWQLVESMLDADEHKGCFIVEPESNTVRFGNGVQGKIPEKGISRIKLAQLERTYFDQGNIKLDYLAVNENGMRFRCLTPASGGRKIPSLEGLRQIMQSQLSNQHLCVTAQDYEQLVMETPGLMLRKAKCLPLYKPGLSDYPNRLAENSVSILVIPYGTQRINALNPAYRANLSRQVEAHRLVTTEVHILDPIYYEIQVYCEISSPYNETEAINEAKRIIRELDNFDFGESIAKSVFYKALSASALLSNIQNISLRSTKPLIKNRLGDLEIPVNGLGIIDTIEIVMIQD